MLLWIFSAMMVLLFWIRRIWGPICREMFRVSSRSYSFFSIRLHRSARSRAAWASSGRPLVRALASAAASSFSRTDFSFFLPARIYMLSSLK